MSEPRNALHARDSHIWTLRMALIIVTFVAAGLVGIIYTKQNEFKIHVPPDLSKGSKIKPGELQAPNSYAFANYVWSGINEWTTAGKTDYPANIKTYECYVTPAFLKWIKTNEREKSEAGELGRTRALSVEKAYAAEMSTAIGNNTFNVNLITTVHERIEGLPIKDIIVRYPLRVVPDTRTCNLMGMALDGFYEQPQRTEPEQSHALENK